MSRSRRFRYAYSLTQFHRHDPNPAQHEKQPESPPSEESQERREFVFDAKRSAKLNRRLDIRLLPLLCWVYLLNFLDRGNIGNARVLNAETGDDLLSQTNMTSNGYAVTVTLFSVAYAVFEVPSNWVMKHYVRPSLWLACLLFSWG